MNNAGIVFTFYLMILLTAQSSRMMNNGWEMNPPWPMRYYPGICLEKLVKTRQRTRHFLKASHKPNCFIHCIHMHRITSIMTQNLAWTPILAYFSSSRH
jgi:hypothetical protein